MQQIPQHFQILVEKLTINARAHLQIISASKNHYDVGEANISSNY